jgi:hypothetical protein
MLPILVLAAQMAGVAPLPPQSQAETPAMRAAASLAASTAAAPQRFRTTAEKTSYRETGTYQEVLDFYRALAQASPYARL